LRRPDALVQTAFSPFRRVRMLILVLLALVVLAIGIPAVLAQRRHSTRQARLARLLDLADEIERLLDATQQRMAALQPVVSRVSADIAAVAQASLESNLPIREAKRDVLQHRLWIQKHGLTATPAELDTALAAIERARDRLAAELAQLDKAGSDLAEATEAADEAARREPPTLRRPPDA
jgi:predicted  nucleic acid-binding Zn-ribbon protein